MKLSALPVLFTAAAFAVSPGYALAQHVDVGPGGVSVHGHGHGHGHVDNHHHVEKPSTSRSTWTITMMTTVKATSQ